MKACFGFPEDQPKFFIKYFPKDEREQVTTEAANMQHSYDAVDSFYAMDSSRQQQLLEPTYREQRPPPKVRIPKLFRVVHTKEHIALLAEFIEGETLDWRIRVECNKTDFPYPWMPNPHSQQALVFQHDLRVYADAIGLMLALPAPPDARLGPLGGGFPNHSIFLDEDTGLSALPYRLTSLDHLAEVVNKVRTCEKKKRKEKE